MLVSSSSLIDVDITHLDAHLKGDALGLLACLAIGACLNLKGVNLIVKVHQIGRIIIGCGRAAIFFSAPSAALLAEKKNDMLTDVVMMDEFFMK